MKDLYCTNGDKLNMIGIGTFPLIGNDLAKVIVEAINIGYQLIDTSDNYRGETGIGIGIDKLISQKDIKRDQIFIQTKISGNTAHTDDPLAAFYFSKYSPFMKRHSINEIVNERVSISLREMKCDYLDSLLIHLPYDGYFLDIWETMIELKKKGLVRYIGVSNFRERHIEKLIKTTGQIPDINEIYISPISIKEEQLEYANKYNIQIMAYSPLMDIVHNKIDKKYFNPLIEKYKKNITQIILRWNIDRGCIPLPKTKNLQRLKENFNIFDFYLTSEEVEYINKLNINYQYLTESKICPGI